MGNQVVIAVENTLSDRRSCHLGGRHLEIVRGIFGPVLRDGDLGELLGAIEGALILAAAQCEIAADLFGSGVLEHRVNNSWAIRLHGSIADGLECIREHATEASHDEIINIDAVEIGVAHSISDKDHAQFALSRRWFDLEDAFSLCFNESIGDGGDD